MRTPPAANEIAALDVTMRTHAFEKGGDDLVGPCARAPAQICNPAWPVVECLGKRRERPSNRRDGRRTAEQLDELAASHSITSSARASNVAGTSRPSAFAVLRLMISSNFVGRCTGRSAGLAPLRMRST